MILEKLIDDLLGTDLVEAKRVTTEQSLIRHNQKRSDLIAFLKLIINESNVPNKREYLYQAVLNTFRDKMLNEYLDTIFK